MHVRAIVYFIISFGLIIPLAIPQPGLASDTLSLEEALAIARQNNPALQMGEQDVAASEAGIIKAKAYPNPDVNVRVGALPHRENGNTEVSGQALIVDGEVSQEVEAWGKRGLRKKIAEKDLALTRSEQLVLWQDTALAVKQAYYQVLLMQNLSQIARDNRELAERFLGSTELKFQENEVPYSDVLRTRLELIMLRKQLVGTEEDLKTGKRSLNLLLGRPLETTVSLKDAFRYRALGADLDALVAQALRDRPELAAAKIQVERWDDAVSFSKRTYLPNPRLSVWGEKDGQEINTGGGLGLQIPLWNRGKGEQREAKSRKDRAAIAQTYQTQLVEREVRDVYSDLRKTAKTLEVEQEGLETSAELIRTSFQGYQEGKASFLAFMETMQAVNQFREEYFSSLARWHIERAALEKAIGSSL